MTADFYVDKNNNLDIFESHDKSSSLLNIDKNFQLGVQMHRQGKLEQAKEIYTEILAYDPNNYQAWHLSGILALQYNAPALAAKLIAMAISLNPLEPVMYFNQAKALERLELHDEAIASYDKAISLQPNYVKAYINRGVVLMANGKLDEAISSYNSAISLKPDSAEAYCNRGNALEQAHRWTEAVESYDLALSFNPVFVNAHINRANTLLAIHRIEDAIAGYKKALSFEKNNPLANWNLAHTLLLNGDFHMGWEQYEWRWEYGGNARYKRNLNGTFWQGKESIQGKKILLHHEQGLGDSIQFFRYVKLVKNLGATVILEVPKALISLMKDSKYVDIIIQTGHSLPEFDFHSPLISLPLAFSTTLKSIPSIGPYVVADSEKIGFWRERLSLRSRLKVGVVWSGGFRPEQPELWAINERRNIPLDIFAKALSSLNVDFFSLQKGDPAESEIRGSENQYWPDGNFFNYASELEDFSDTAALIENLDLILSVDTSTAHLAAAMGKPTWILNRYDTCWRWMLGRDDSPWYTAVKLYRQNSDMRWEPVLQRVLGDISKLSNGTV